jgi:glycolate oxidase
MTDATATLEASDQPRSDAHAELLTALAAAVGAAHVLTEPDLVEPFRRDMQVLADAGRPLAVVRPRTTDEVAAVVAACARFGVPVVPRGAGSGMTGGANAQDGAVTLVTTRMTDIEVDEEARLVRVQPGAVTDAVKAAAAQHGLHYAPDPTSSSWCTIGGNLANGSAGPCGARYGVTADAVRSLEVVLASGEVLQTGRATLKGVAGYDLAHLFVGSEGTLGVITSATLALSEAPAERVTTMAAFESLAAAVDAVTAFLATGERLALLELLDAPMLEANEKYLGAQLMEDGPQPAAVLIGQSDARDTAATSRFSEACEAAGAALVYTADDAEEGALLLAYWDSLEATVEAMGTWILHEVTVPRNRLVELIERVHALGAEHDVWVGVHGHAQDGTVHPMIVVGRDRPEALAAARAVYDAIIAAAVELGGPVTGEHGIGRM